MKKILLGGALGEPLVPPAVGGNASRACLDGTLSAVTCCRTIIEPFTTPNCFLALTKISGGVASGGLLSPFGETVLCFLYV